MALLPSRFVLTPTEAKNCDSTDLFWLLDRNISLGLAPICGFNVGTVRAAGLGFSGTAYLGINVELPGLPLKYSIHAVQFLIANLELNSQTQSQLHLTHIAVSANVHPPCRDCCQFLQEIFEPSIIKFVRKDPIENLKVYMTLETLLSHHEFVVSEVGRHLFDARLNKLVPYEASTRENIDMLRLALGAANQSFAPYSNCPSGMALRDRNDNLYKGWYMESAAGNPSVGPVQAALVDFVIRGSAKFDDIVEAELVEMKDAGPVRQEETAKMILKKIASPNCTFRVSHCVYMPSAF